MIDSYSRKISYARISLTNACNLKCSYCSTSENVSENVPLIFYETLIDALCELGIDKIRFTGGEPLLNKNIVNLVKYTKSHSIIKDIAITTNGVLLDKYLDDLYKSGLSRINLSLDTRDREIYNDLTGFDRLEEVENNIKQARDRGLKIKINAVLLKGITDKQLEGFLEFGFENSIQIRFIELMPIGDNIDYYNQHYLSSSDLVKKIDCVKLDKHDDIATYYCYKDKYTFGVISPISNHFCDKCNRIRITSRGTLRLCLHSDNEIDLLPYKDNKAEMVKVLSNAISNKPEKHYIDEKKFVKGNMVEIGG